eukprot:scaffold36532_cov118-Isochrysis_galbana.AAC.4
MAAYIAYKITALSLADKSRPARVYATAQRTHGGKKQEQGDRRAKKGCFSPAITHGKTGYCARSSKDRSAQSLRKEKVFVRGEQAVLPPQAHLGQPRILAAGGSAGRPSAVTAALSESRNRSRDSREGKATKDRAGVNSALPGQRRGPGDVELHLQRQVPHPVPPLDGTAPVRQLVVGHCPADGALGRRLQVEERVRRSSAGASVIGHTWVTAISPSRLQGAGPARPGTAGSSSRASRGSTSAVRSKSPPRGSAVADRMRASASASGRETASCRAGSGGSGACRSAKRSGGAPSGFCVGFCEEPRLAGTPAATLQSRRTHARITPQPLGVADRQQRA